jgi:threonine/homoserine/homoserine lactone efflux protein
MLGTHDLPLFIVSGLLLNITPGADSLLIASRAAAQGFKAGAWAALGVSAGCLVHVLCAAVGLSAILATSTLAFTVLKLLGAAYLVVIGLGMVLQRVSSTPPPAPTPAAASLPTAGRAVFVQGFLTNVLNPKVALFFLAFVPQFIEPAAANKALAFLFLGGIFTLNSSLWCLLLAWAAARVGSSGIGQRLGSWVSRVVGALFVCLGVRLALSGSPPG